MVYAYLAGILIGLSKAGVKGPGVAIVGLMALDFGAKASTGLLLPMLIIADILAVYYYHSHANWKVLRQFMPMMFTGVAAAALTGKYISENDFKFWMAAAVLIGFIFLFVRDLKWKDQVPNGKYYSEFMGFCAGFTSMIGNLAGPFTNLYFLSKQTPKNEFIGTAAWMFMLVNLFKLPFHALMWQTIDTGTLVTDLKILPTVFLGFALGIFLVKRISDFWYRIIIYTSTLIGISLILLS